ncbi:flavin reductase family protein [Succinispira mobilis]|uniref:flavin reductase family protein n=1 Tax=Succinispira mobilis TaxID=78120 RepID=UPI00316AD86D
MLITAAKEGKSNTMTASWGGLGVMWGKKVAYVVIRPQRYTKEFIDVAESFSLSFLPEKFRKELSYLGSVSGRDEDKIAKAGLSLTYQEEVPYFEESELVLICKKLFVQEFKDESFLDKSILDTWYKAGDNHYLYIAEIIDVLKK